MRIKLSISRLMCLHLTACIIIYIIPCLTGFSFKQITDIIQAITLGDEASLVAFCQGVQKGAPVDAYVTPEPWDMPGYESQVIMAAGAFTMGASIELSADAPIREPFAAWMQGALTYPSGKVGLKLALQSMLEQGALRL